MGLLDKIKDTASSVAEKEKEVSNDALAGYIHFSRIQVLMN